MRIALVCLTLLVAGCAMPAHMPAAVRPLLSRDEAERMALKGDELVRAALAGNGADPLFSAFRGRALTTLRLQVARLTERGVLIEERSVSRRLVRFDPASGEAILTVSSEYRMTTRQEINPPWAATERQWWVRFEFDAGTWWIVDQENLPPDRWVAT